MKFVIRKVPERNTEKLEAALGGAIIVNDVEHKGAFESFRDALRAADDDAVYVQDDMILGSGFKDKVAEKVAMNRASVIVFSNPTTCEKYDIEKEGFYNPRIAGWLLCTYIPKRIADLFLEQNESGIWKPRRWDVSHGLDDVDFCRWLEFIGEDVYLCIPNLAGHPANKSVAAKSRQPRICKNFNYSDVEVQWRRE